MLKQKSRCETVRNQRSTKIKLEKKKKKKFENSPTKKPTNQNWLTLDNRPELVKLLSPKLIVIVETNKLSSLDDIMWRYFKSFFIVELIPGVLAFSCYIIVVQKNFQSRRKVNFPGVGLLLSSHSLAQTQWKE